MTIPFTQFLPKEGHYKINPTLLWEYDPAILDCPELRWIVVQRVVERGFIEDFAAAIEKYGGVEAFREIIKNEVRHLSPRDRAFVCFYFNLKEDELECFKRKQLREEYLSC